MEILFPKSVITFKKPPNQPAGRADRYSKIKQIFKNIASPKR